MQKLLLMTLPLWLVAACSDKNDAAEERLERAAETSATVAGPTPAALGLSEAQLLDADIVGSDGREVGEVAQVLRDASGMVERLLVELEGPGDRYVHVPILGLTPVVRGTDTDLQMAMTKARLDALPEVKLPPP